MNTLNILWTSDNKDTAINMIAMYAINAKKERWWQHVNVIIWGASAKLVAHDNQVKQKLRKC
jgi:hypothetical protein